MADNSVAKLLSGDRTRWYVFVAVLAALLASRLLPMWTDMSRAAFDRASTLSPPRPQHPGYVIVAIDEPSFSAVGKPWPWPRALHSRLIRTLKDHGARAIALDIVFAEPAAAADDKALSASADRSVVLAADETLQESPQGVMLLRTGPIAPLLGNGAKVGLTSVPVDPDGVVRQIPRYADSLPRQMLRISGVQPPSPSRSLIQYFGPRGTYPTVSYYQALDPDHYLPPGYFKGREVIVGFALQATADANKAADMFETSFGGGRSGLTPGAEIHATIADNLREQLWVTPAPRWVSLIMLVLGAVAGLVASIPDGLVRRWAGFVGFAALALITLWVSLRFGRLWISPAEPLVGLATSFAALGISDFAVEQGRRRQIHAAFGQYLAPAIVDRLVEDPSRVKLSGERKVMTILFADVRGFTTISEEIKDRPETLTRLINQILEPLSAAVLNHGGTIDKYVGDCVMAFWNAPVDDPDHARHALAAALDMIDALPALNREVAEILRGTAIPTIAIGVGIDSGECVVGNMGTERRFNYTVIGDAVNVASRLEGLSKEYKVRIVAGETTVALAGKDFAFQELDCVAVRGTRRVQRIYTVARLGEGVNDGKVS